MPSATSTRRASSGSSLIGAGLGSVMVGVWTWYAQPVCQPPPGPLVVMCIVEPLYLLAVLFLLAGASLIGIGSVSLLRWRPPR